jgi:broad specificity phosphatase PhoE
VSGVLARQQDSAREVMIGLGVDLPLQVHAGLDEYDGESIYRAHTDGADPLAHQRRDARDYWRTFRAAYEAWAGGGLPGAAESWRGFGERIDAALSAATEGVARDDAVLVVSSGGVIGCTVAALLGAPAQAAIELNLQCRNASFCELVTTRHALRLLSYNSIPHLDQAGRRDAITHV